MINMLLALLLFAVVYMSWKSTSHVRIVRKARHTAEEAGIQPLMVDKLRSATIGQDKFDNEQRKRYREPHPNDELVGHPNSVSDIFDTWQHFARLAQTDALDHSIRQRKSIHAVPNVDHPRFLASALTPIGRNLKDIPFEGDAGKPSSWFHFY
jgi:hypothetical protein